MGPLLRSRQRCDTSRDGSADQPSRPAPGADGVRALSNRGAGWPVLCAAQAVYFWRDIRSEERRSSEKRIPAPREYCQAAPGTSAVIRSILASPAGGRCRLAETRPPDWVGLGIYLLPLGHVFKHGMAGKLRGNCPGNGRCGPLRLRGELREVSARSCGGDSKCCITHLHSRTPSKQQVDQTTDHTKKKNINQARTPSTQKSTAQPFTRTPTIPPIPTSGDQITQPS